MADQPPYRKPYFDACIFIAWIKGERVSQIIDGQEVFEERGLIGEHLLKLASQEHFSVITSALTLAEVHKHKGKERLDGKETQDFIDFCENDFITIVAINRIIGEDANKLCQKYHLYPNDAIHLACALKAGCDVLLSWDELLNKVADAGIRIEKPVIWNPPEKPKLPKQLSIMVKEVK